MRELRIENVNKMRRKQTPLEIDRLRFVRKIDENLIFDFFENRNEKNC